MTGEPQVTIHGHVHGEPRRQVMRGPAVACESLALESISVWVTDDDRELPRELVAGAGRNGEIWIRASLVQQNGVLLAMALMEEAAHVKMTALGALDGVASFLGALVQEYFASWYVFTELCKVAPRIVALYDDSPIPAAHPTPDFGYRLGNHLGPEAAGIDKAHLRVEAWLKSASIHPAVRDPVRRVRALGSPSSDPVELATRAAALARDRSG